MTKTPHAATLPATKTIASRIPLLIVSPPQSRLSFSKAIPLMNPPTDCEVIPSAPVIQSRASFAVVLASSKPVNPKPSACPFQFVEQGSHAAIVHQGREILRLDKNIAFFGLSYFVRDQVMVPGGNPEVAFVPVFSAYPRPGILDVRYEVEADAESLRVRIIPAKVVAGPTNLLCWREEDVIGVRLENGRYVWQQDACLTFFKDIDLDAAESAMRVYRFHHVDGRPARCFQYIDPAPAGSSGPSVPMLRDWLDYHEPYTGPDGFREHWKREYVSIIFQDPDGGFSVTDLNKTRWSNLTLDNRRSRPCAAKGLLYLVKDSGQALEYDIDAPSHFHHVCEWGMDFHAWCDLDPFVRGSVIPAGTTISCASVCRLVDAAVVAPVIAKARRIELTPEEFAIANRPAYEEPENSFNVSALDRIDAHPWFPTSEGCSWLRDGGYAPGTGSLVIRNSYCDCGSWRYIALGSQQWGNPIITGVCYRISAWVRVEEFIPDPSETQGPQVGVELTQFNGPAVGATQTVTDCGWSLSLITNFAPLPTRIGWTKIELITAPMPNYILRGTLKLRLHGRGIAWFSGVRWEPVE